MRGKLHRFGNISDYAKNKREERIKMSESRVGLKNIREHGIEKENGCKEIKVREN